MTIYSRLEEIQSRWQPYPSYKNSGVEWLVEIPTHWDVWKVSHAFKRIGSGSTPPSDQHGWYENGEIPWVQTSELRENRIYDTEKKVTFDALEKFTTLRVYSPGTLLIAMYGATIGRLAILGVYACTNQACCALADPVSLDTKFVFYWLFGFREHIIVLGSGGGQPNISQGEILNLRLPAPDLSEQRAISDFLDHETAKIVTLIAKKQRLIELLQEKSIALISHVVTKGLDPTVPMKDSGVEWLGEIPEHWSIGRNKRLFIEVNKRSVTGEEELLSVSHITGVTRRSEKEVYMFMAETLEGYKICKPGDLVINTMWAWMGALGISHLLGVVSPSYNVYRLRKCNTLLPKYLDYLYRTPQHIMEINRYSNGVWSSRLRLYPDEFFQMCTPIPPYDEQQTIFDYLNYETVKIDGLIKKIQNAINKLKEYRTALISAAVTGRIDVRNQV